MASADVPAAITIGRFDLAEVGERAPDGSIWIEGVRSGTHHAVRSDRVATVTPDDIESMHRGFVTVLAEGWFGAGQGAPIRNDPTHAAFKGSADSALHARIGSIHETQVRLNDDASKSLLMRVTWTDQGRALVDSKQFSSGSIEALPPGTPSKITGEPLADWSLVGFVITNTPMVGGLAPLAAADLPPSTQLEQDMTDKIINQALGLADTASDSERFEAIRLLTDKANKAEALELGLSEVTASRDDLKTERDELADWRWDRVLSDAVSAGRIAPTQKDSYRQIVATL
jgi:phage I-like protein